VRTNRTWTSSRVRGGEGVRRALILAGALAGTNGSSVYAQNASAKPAPAVASPAPTSGAPTEATGTPTSPAGPASAPAPGASGGAYTVRLHDLEQRVDELKEQIFRSKARLNLLKETVLHGVIAGARSTILHRNEMGSMYTPVELAYSLDGTEIFSRRDDSGKMLEQKELEIYSGSITPGNHTLSVKAIYQGNGYGVFSYLKGYKFNIKSSHTFTASEGKLLQLKVVGFEKGNPVTTDPKDRPAIDFHETVVSDKEAAMSTNKQSAASK
jgi:hypothetical protein